MAAYPTVTTAGKDTSCCEVKGFKFSIPGFVVFEEAAPPAFFLEVRAVELTGGEKGAWCGTFFWGKKNTFFII